MKIKYHPGYRDIPIVTYFFIFYSYDGIKNTHKIGTIYLRRFDHKCLKRILSLNIVCFRLLDVYLCEQHVYFQSINFVIVVCHFCFLAFIPCHSQHKKMCDMGMVCVWYMYAIHKLGIEITNTTVWWMHWVSLAWYTCILISVGLCVLSCGDETRIESARKRRKNLSAKRHSNIVFLFVHTLSCRAMNVWIHNNKQPAQMIRRARLLWIDTYTSCMCIIWMCYGVEKYIYKIKIKVKETEIETDRSKSKAVK